MKLHAEDPGRRSGNARRTPPKVGFTMVEMVVALGIACLLMVAVVAFLVSGMVSSTKTSAINDTTQLGFDRCNILFLFR